MKFFNKNNGEPDRIRTCDQQLRRLLLYPAELRALKGAADLMSAVRLNFNASTGRRG